MGDVEIEFDQFIIRRIIIMEAQSKVIGVENSKKCNILKTRRLSIITFFVIVLFCIYLVLLVYRLAMYKCNCEVVCAGNLQGVAELPWIL